MMETPPLFEGAVQERLMVVRPDAFAVTFVGASGAVATNATVVALASLDGELTPTALIARTR